MHVDLNCDLGEGCGNDLDLLPLITSANVAAGFHAGDPASAFSTLQAAAQHGVCVGVHPGYADREHFGRLELSRSEQQIFEELVYQCGALSFLARAAGTSVRYLKPHGALYHQACRDEEYARPVIAAAQVAELAVVGLPGSTLQRLSHGLCRFVAEGFADRRYQADGTLVPRSDLEAFVADPEEAVLQVTWLLREHKIETICVHGDNPNALAFVRLLRKELDRQAISVRAFA